MEQIKTFLLLGSLSVLLVFLGGYLGGTGGMVIALVMAGGMNFYAYYFSDTMILKHYNAQEVDPREAPVLYRVVERLVERADMPMPKVYIIHDHIPNAFATGRNPEHAAVAITTGLLELLNEDEIEGVMAHELSHVEHRDILVATIAATIAAMIAAMIAATIAAANRKWLETIMIRWLITSRWSRRLTSSMTTSKTAIDW